MKKSVGIILMAVSGVSLCLLLGGEVILAKEGRLPTNATGWVGNLLLPVITLLVFLLGNTLRKKKNKKGKK